MRLFSLRRRRDGAAPRKRDRRCRGCGTVVVPCPYCRDLPGACARCFRGLHCPRHRSWWTLPYGAE